MTDESQRTARDERRAKDATLVEASVAGDELAFGRLYDGWYDRVHDLARRIVGDDAAAADVAQDTFIKAWQGLDGLREPSAFGGWLLRIARTTALNQQRSRRRSTVVDTSGPGALETLDTAAHGPAGFTVEDQLSALTDPAAVAENAEMARLLFEAADALGERDAQVLDLHLRHGLEPAEIGEVVGINRNAANQLVHRLRRRLKRAVEARVLWRDGSPTCEALSDALHERSMTVFDETTARFIDTHAEQCDECRERRRTRLAPAALFGAAPIIAMSIYRQQVAAALEAEGVPLAGSAAAGGVSASGPPVSGLSNATEPRSPTGEPTMTEPTPPTTIFSSTWIRLALLMATIVVATVIVIAFNVFGDDDPTDTADDPPATTQPEDLPPDGGDSGESADDSVDGSDGDGDAAAPAGDDTSAQPGGDDEAATDGGGGDSEVISTPFPPTASVCGAQEFLGGLPEFIVRLADPKLLPPIVNDFGPDRYDLIDEAPLLTSPVAPVLSTPISVLDGANKAYRPIAEAVLGQCPGISGDPHVYTIDGARYDFQAVGEYVALRADDGSIEVQIRTLPYSSSTRASSVGGVALTVDGRTLVVDRTADDLVTLDDVPIEAPGAIRTDNGAYVLRDDTGVAVFWPDEATAVGIARIDTDAMGVYFTLADDLGGAVEGLMGDADGNPRNDPSLPDGEVVADDFESLNVVLRDAWRVTGDESLFAGPSRYDAGFPTEPLVLSTDERRAAREICVAAGVVVGGLLENCIIDVAVSGDAAAADVQREAQTDRFLLRAAECPRPAAGAASSDPGRTWDVGPVEITGERAWSYIGDEGEDPLVRSVSAATDDTALVVDTRNGVRLIDRDGAVIWGVESTPAEDVAPLVVGDSAFFATTDGIAAVGLDGTACWQLVSYAGERFVALGFADGTLIAKSNSSAVALVLAIDPATGEILWQRVAESRTGAFFLDTPVATGEGLIIVPGDRGDVLALDVATGDTVWIDEADRDDTVSGVSVLDGVAYVASRGSGVRALDLATGARLWATEAPGGGATLSIAVGNGVAVVADESMVRRIDLSSGEVRWSTDENDRVQAFQPIISGDLVYLTVRPRQVVALDVRDGSEVMRIDDSADGSGGSAAEFRGGPVRVGDLLLAVDRDGGLVAFR